jgi:hypothetical protein
MAKTKIYTVRKLNPQLLALAVEAYRLAVQYDRRNELKWETRGAELRKADEFSRVRCAWENSSFLGERIVARASDVLLAIVRADRILPGQNPFDLQFFDKSKDRDFLRARKAVDATVLAFGGLR